MTCWRAEFNDDSHLNQFNDKGDEIQFQKVLDRIKDLKSLSVSQVESCIEKFYRVSLLDGMFVIEGRCIYILDTNIYPLKELKNIRPIYFERWKHDFSATSGKSLGKMRLFTAVGFQANFKGKNVKRYLEVYPSGDCKVRNK